MFNTLLVQPLNQALLFLYDSIAFNDLGVAIILLTIIIRLILFPLFYKSFHNQTLLQKLQPKIKEIQHNHKDDREQQARAMLDLYKEHKVNPFSSFLLILVQLPILIALYRVFLGINSNLKNLNTDFLGLIDLTNQSIIIVGLAAIFQYLHGRLTLPKLKPGEKEPDSLKITKKMIYFGPVITVVILYTLPAAVGLYWLTTSIFSLAQQIAINKKINQEYNNGADKNNNQTFN